VTGTVETSVDWSIAEGPAGGSVSTSGVYTAPVADGVYHVVAASRADPSRQRVASVTVGLSDSPAPSPPP
jgi:chitinase